MIDFHNHILPGVDDGAKTIEESIEMIRCAEHQGITDIVSTVHYQHPKMEGKNTSYDFILSVKDRLVEEIYTQNINMNIHLGAEVFFNFNLLDIIDNPIVTFLNHKYMLVEFQIHQFPKNFDEHLYNLAISGIKPIIAHPERYKPVQDDIAIIEKLINSGCMVQVDAGSILGHFGNKCKLAAKELLIRNMVHIIGSDAHGLGKRNFCLKEAVTEIEKFIEYDVTPLVLDNPRKIINGDFFEIPNFDYKKSKNTIFTFISNFLK